MIPTFWSSRRVLVTGGAGFIGSNLAVRLGGQVRVLRVVDNLERGRREHLRGVSGPFEFVQGDLREPGVAEAVCAGMDVVFHLASKVGGIRTYQESAYEVAAANGLIDVRVLEASRLAGVETFIYASSAHVYPEHLQQQPGAPALREDDALPAAPALSYGWAKLFTERLLAAGVRRHDGPPLRTCALRITGAYGPPQSDDLDSGSAIPVFIRRAIAYPADAPFRVLGTGMETRSFCHVSDVVEALVRAAAITSERGSLPPINIGSEGRVTIAELVAMVVRASGKGIPIVYDPSAHTAIWGQAVDCARAHELLDGWTPSVPLAEGIGRFYAHQLARWRDEGRRGGGGGVGGAAE